MKRVPLKRRPERERAPRTDGPFVPLRPAPRSQGLSQGCGLRRFASLPAAEKAVERGAEGRPYECRSGGLAHWHLRPPAPAPYIPPAVRRLVLARDGWRCVCCGHPVERGDYSLGHRVRASQGGEAVPQNLVTLQGLGAAGHHGRIDLYKDPAGGAKGYRLPSMTDGKPTDPALFPVMIMSAGGSGATVWLTPDGKYDTRPPAGAR